MICQEYQVKRFSKSEVGHRSYCCKTPYINKSDAHSQVRATDLGGRYYTEIKKGGDSRGKVKTVTGITDNTMLTTPAYHRQQQDSQTQEKPPQLFLRV